MLYSTSARTLGTLSDTIFIAIISISGRTVKRFWIFRNFIGLRNFIGFHYVQLFCDLQHSAPLDQFELYFYLITFDL